MEMMKPGPRQKQDFLLERTEWKDIPPEEDTMPAGFQTLSASHFRTKGKVCLSGSPSAWKGKG